MGTVGESSRRKEEPGDVRQCESSPSRANTVYSGDTVCFVSMDGTHILSIREDVDAELVRLDTRNDLHIFTRIIFFKT